MQRLAHSLTGGFGTEQPLSLNLVCLLCLQVCPLTVPKCYIAVKGAQKQYQKLMRFQESQDARTAQVTFERADAYMKRNSGFVALYAALAQSDRQGNPIGLDNAWRYLARSVSNFAQVGVA